MVKGPRSLSVLADKMGSGKTTASRLVSGHIPDAWLYLVRLRQQEGIDLNWLLTGTGENGGR